MILTPLGYIYENAYEFVASHLHDIPHLGMKAPVGGTPTYSGPKPLVSPYGPNYSMHPELSRPIHGIVGTKIISAATSAPVLGATALFVGPMLLFEGNKAVIDASPEEQQRGLWQMFSSALTGTWGGDYSGLI
jgi:hypothetical protein